MRPTVKDFGRVDGLFANAGRYGTGTPLVDTSLEDWRKVMAVNLDGVFLCLREASRQLISQGSGGSLVAVSPTSAIHGAAGNEAYGTAKTAVTGLVRALAVSLARFPDTANCLLPGWTVTELASPAFENEYFREVTTRGLRFVVGLTLGNLKRWVPFLLTPHKHFIRDNKFVLMAGTRFSESCVLNHSNYFIASQDSGSISPTVDFYAQAPQRGTTRDALAIPAFRRLYIGSFLSGIGRWMQAAALGVQPGRSVDLVAI